MYITENFLKQNSIRAIQRTREILSESSDPIRDANNMVFDLTTFHSPFKDNEEAAIMFAQYVVEGTIKKRYNTFEYAKQRVLYHMEHSPRMFACHESYNYQKQKITYETIENVRVAIKKDGKIKKGGKQEIAEQMYKTMVLEQGMKNADFVRELQSKANLTLYGARTYAYNMKKKFGVQK